MSLAEIPDELPLQRNRALLVQRPAHRRPPPSPGEPPWWDRTRVLLPAFARQVLLRPVRIGTLTLLGGMTAVVLVGAEGWWIVLGITLFQAAATTLVVTWVEVPAPARRPAGNRDAPSPALELVPRPRRPWPDE